MVHGIQNDWFSYGVVLPNTIAHDVFGDGLWILRRAISDRVDWFLTFVNNMKEQKLQTNLEKVSSC